tara:strand:- start:1101 stop:1583 length:483 start_codon:yes stop_codon:yes gene_type:complete
METRYNKLLNIIEDQNVAMLTTKQNDGNLKSRPMGISELNEDGSIWFFTNENSCKANEIEAHPHVNLSITDSKNQGYVSISGKASIHHDKDKMKELMNPMVKAWFPDGIDDPTISLIKVEMDKAAYWTNDGNRMTQLFELGKAWVMGEKAEMGEHETFSA